MIQPVCNAIILVRVSLSVAGHFTASTVLAQPGTPCLPDHALATFGRIPFQSGSRIEAIAGQQAAGNFQLSLRNHLGPEPESRSIAFSSFHSAFA